MISRRLLMAVVFFPQGEQLMYLLTVKEEFDAAHRIIGYPGKCDRLHGHCWTVEVSVEGSQLDKLGMVVDFKYLKSLVRNILNIYDHRYLNDLPDFADKNPTAEHIAAAIYHRVAAGLEGNASVKSVTVWESPGSSVIYSGE